MKKRVVFLYAALVLGGTLHGTLAQAQNPSLEEVPVQPDWFEVRYDDIREITQFRTKDPYGPGYANTVDSAPLKLAFSATMPGKNYDPTKPVAVTLFFNRNAGLKNASPTNADSDYRPFKESQLRALDTCKDVTFLLPTGQRVSLTAGENSYRTSYSTGLIGEGYLWETRAFPTDLKLLSSLSNGAKVALCDLTFELNKDQVSQVRTLLALIQGTGAPAPQPPAANANAPLNPAASVSNNPAPSWNSPAHADQTASSDRELPFLMKLMAGPFLPFDKVPQEGFQVGFGGSVLLGKALTKNFSLGLKGGFSNWSSAYIPGLQFNRVFTGLSAQLYVTDNSVRPYFLLGGGADFDAYETGTRDSFFELDPGFGVSFGREKVSFFVELQPGFVFGFNDYIALDGGLNFNL